MLRSRFGAQARALMGDLSPWECSAKAHPEYGFLACRPAGGELWVCADATAAFDRFPRCASPSPRGVLYPVTIGRSNTLSVRPDLVAVIIKTSASYPKAPRGLTIANRRFSPTVGTNASRWLRLPFPPASASAHYPFSQKAIPPASPRILGRSTLHGLPQRRGT